jgi:hypothetical protein
MRRPSRSLHERGECGPTPGFVSAHPGEHSAIDVIRPGEDIYGRKVIYGA